MALTFGFYDSLNHDRLYNAQQMSAIFDGIINDGVFASVGSHFSVVPGTGMHVLVKSGRAWFNSTWTLNDSDIDLTIDAADSLLGRIDTVVLEVNSEQATRANSIKVVKGTAASTPAKPTLTNTTTVHQHPLAHITVAKNTTAITASMIEIVVGKTDCPFVTAILQTTDITNLFEKWENDFQTWFSTVRSTLDGDVALNLQNQIDANWRKTLRETTPPKIGLASTATPADMFDVLADVGNLHVWRKTVTTTEEVPAVPAGYTLGDVETNLVVASSWGTVSVFGVAFSWAETPTVDSSTGEVSLGSNPSGGSYYNITSSSWTDLRDDFNHDVVGNFCTLRHNRESGNTITDLLFVPSDSVMTRETVDADNYKYNIVFSKAQRVTGYPYTPAIPAGTSVTYPVSTNRNAYQEGSDAKPAGYVLGDVVSGVFVAPNSSAGIRYSDSISVSTDGILSFSGTPPYLGVTYGGASASDFNVLKGKFVTVESSDSLGVPFGGQAMVYIPSDATFSKVSDSGWTVSKCQPVTGYPAIPAGTVIEYLGCLGDKARVQVLSYVGIGTYGVDNPTTITADFPIKALIFLVKKTKTTYGSEMYSVSASVDRMVTNHLTTTSWRSVDGLVVSPTNDVNPYAKKSKDGKTIYIYGGDAYYQWNSSGDIYYFLVIG